MCLVGATGEHARSASVPGGSAGGQWGEEDDKEALDLTLTTTSTSTTTPAAAAATVACFCLLVLPKPCW